MVQKHIDFQILCDSCMEFITQYGEDFLDSYETQKEYERKARKAYRYVTKGKLHFCNKECEEHYNKNGCRPPYMRSQVEDSDDNAPA